MKKVLLLVASAFSLVGIGQSNMLLYNFDAVAQSLHVNPSLQQQSKVWVGLPGISGISLDYQNSGFSLLDIFEEGTDINDNIRKTLGEMDDASGLFLNSTIDLLGIGFKAGKGYFSLGAQQSIDLKMKWPTQLLTFAYEGNAIPRNRVMSLESYNAEFNIRTNYYLGYQRAIGEKWRVGGRLKYIIGQGHGYVDRMNGRITTTSVSDLVIDTDILIRSSGVANTEDDIEVMDLVFSDNRGFGVDLGATYTVNQRLSFSVSALDIGSINWESDNREYSSKGTFTFDGVDADLADDDPIKDFDDLVDSLEAAFDFSESVGVGYKRSLPSHYYVSGNFHLNEKHSLGALYHLRTWDGDAFHDIGFNYVGKLARGFQATVGYSLINGDASNVGVGLSTKLGPMQFYVMSDNVLGAVNYASLQTTNVRLGLNIAIYEPKEKKMERKKAKAAKKLGKKQNKKTNKSESNKSKTPENEND